MTDLKAATAAEATTAAAVAAPPRPARLQWRPSSQLGELVILLGPALVLFAAFVLLPICIAAYYGLFNWTGYGPLSDFTGLHNYKLVLTDPIFRSSLWHNVIIAVLSLIIQLPISIGIALLLNRRMRGGSFLRLAVFAPYVVSQATTAVLWLLILEPGGFVDELMKAVGLGGLVQAWLADPTIVLYTMFVVLTWQFIGFGIILLLAGLQGIPGELREAAAIDGASGWATTRYITLPLLGPTIRIWIFLSMIGSLQVFDLVWIMTLGGPANASSTMVTYMIFFGFHNLEFGYGSATAVILFIISFVFAFLYQRFALRRDTHGALTRAVR
ncbi:MAG TPA: sugar ABC transporter permease [Streptosporangiaceae bacterium]|nr:sugar ABC transporter permease [Streptosporangiaceae bacterium]